MFSSTAGYSVDQAPRFLELTTLLKGQTLNTEETVLHFGVLDDWSLTEGLLRATKTFADGMGDECGQQCFASKTCMFAP